MAERILNVVTNVGNYDPTIRPDSGFPNSVMPGTSSRRPRSSKPSSARPAAYRWSREP